MTPHRVVQLPYAPEWNPVERSFRDLRRALEPILNAWQAALERVKHLVRLVLDPGHPGSPTHR